MIASDVSETLIALDLIDPPLTELRLEYPPDELHTLAKSMASLGLLQPIGLRALPETGRYRRLWGGRRTAAARLLGWTAIPAKVVGPEVPELDAALLENLDRADLTPVEEALALRSAIAAGFPPHALAVRWHRSETWIDQRLDLLTYPDDVRDALHTRRVPLAVAAWLARIDNEPYRAYLLDCAISGGATAAVCRAWVADYEANRPRIIANQVTIDELKARPPSYVLLTECASCNVPVDLALTQTLRICPTCARALLDVNPAALLAPPKSGGTAGAVPKDTA